MPRATCVLAASERTPSRAADTVILPYAQRQTQRGFVFAVSGACIEFDFAEPVLLRTDDVLVLDDGNLVEVVAEPEPLLEVRAADAAALARLAWQLGDRHVSVEVRSNCLRMRRDATNEVLLESLGAKSVAIDAPFEPEGGAYAISGGDRHNHSDHHHHDHHTHDHGHSHGDGHDHHHHDHPHKHD